MTFLLYAATAIVVLWIVRRAVSAVSIGAAIILFLLPLVVMGKAVLTGGAFGAIDLTYVTEPLADLRLQLGVPSPHNGVISDVSCQVFPWRKALQDAYAHGEWPLRNPTMLSGDILAAAGQPGAYFPFTLIALLLPAAISLTFTGAIIFFLAGAGAFLLARELGIRESVALLAAAGWMYSTGLAFFILWALAGAWALLPWVLLATRRCVRAPSLRSSTLLCVTLTLLVLAGHPESALHVVAIGCAYGLFELLRIRRDSLRIVGFAAAAGVVALLLTAIYIMPLVEASHQTMEYEFRTEIYAKVPHGDTYLQSGVRVMRDLFPVFYGERWLLNVGGLSPATASAGSILLALAIVACIRVRRADTWFFAALALFGILAGSNLKQFSALMQHLPLFDIALNEYFAFGGALAIAILAAIALDDAFTRRSVAVPLIVTIALLVVTAGSILPTKWGWAAGFLPDWGHYRMFGEIGCLALVALVLVAHMPRRIAAALILALLLLQRWTEVGDVYSTVPAAVAYPKIPIFAPMAKAKPPFRFAGFFQTFTPNMAAYYGLEDVRGYEAMTFSRYADTYRLWCVTQPVFFNRVDDPGKPFLSFLNVRFMTGYKDWKFPPGWRLLSSYRNSTLWENDNVIERAFIPRHVTANMPDGDALNEMAEVKDFRERAWIKITDLKPQEFANGSGTLSVRRDGYDYDLTADMKSNGWVVLSETAWKGWRVYVDGQRENWFFANHAFIGFWVPEGRHHVRVVYLPSTFVTGRAISLGTLAALVLAVIARSIRRRSGQNVSQLTVSSAIDG